MAMANDSVRQSWDGVMGLFEDNELDINAEWWGPEFRAKRKIEWVEEETEENQKLCLTVAVARQNRSARPVWQLPDAERRKVISTWHRDGERGKRMPGKPARRTKSRDSSNRKLQWSPSFWSDDFTSWIARVVEAVELAADARERTATIPKSVSWKPQEGTSVTETTVSYGARGFCNYCRRKTAGFTVQQTSQKGSRKAHARFASFFCGCDKKNVGQCVRCAVVDYMDAARAEYGDFRVKNGKGKVVGLKPIKCKKLCGVEWDPTSLFVVKGPADGKSGKE